MTGRDTVPRYVDTAIRVPVDHPGDLGGAGGDLGPAPACRGAAEEADGRQFRPGLRRGRRGSPSGDVPGESHGGGQEAGAVSPPVGRGRAGKGPGEAPQRRLPPGTGRRGLLRDQALRPARRAGGSRPRGRPARRHDAICPLDGSGGGGAGVLLPGFPGRPMEEEACGIDLPGIARRAGPDGRLRRGRAGPGRGDAACHRRAGAVLPRSVRGTGDREFPAPDGPCPQGRSQRSGYPDGSRGREGPGRGDHPGRAIRHQRRRGASACSPTPCD